MSMVDGTGSPCRAMRATTVPPPQSSRIFKVSVKRKRTSLSSASTRWQWQWWPGRSPRFRCRSRFRSWCGGTPPSSASSSYKTTLGYHTSHTNTNKNRSRSTHNMSRQGASWVMGRRQSNSPRAGAQGAASSLYRAPTAGNRRR